MHHWVTPQTGARKKLDRHKRECNKAICGNMDGPRDDQTKWSKSDRERHISYDSTYMWNLKYDTNELIYETETDSQT